MRLSNKEELISYVLKGKRIKYMFFWGHQKSKHGITKSCFSQWYESPFAHEDITYKTAEHFMMAEKAKLFNDTKAFNKIISAEEPGKAKRIGREIVNFEEQIWLKNRFKIVQQANLLKFSQDPELKKFILNTENRVLVEASPVDPIWGIGMASDHPDVESPKLWKGLNLLGFALMLVRDELQRA